MTGCSLYGQKACEKLTSVSLPGVTVVSAVAVPAGSMTLPSGPTVTVPSMCRVTARVAPEVSFELWMPVAWKGKLLAAGNGGLAGTISQAAMLKPLARGYATISTDLLWGAPRRILISTDVRRAVGAVSELWSGLWDANGGRIYPGLVPGVKPFSQFMVFNDPAWDWKSFRFEAANGFDSDIDLRHQPGSHQGFRYHAAQQHRLLRERGGLQC
jgi:Tannase and feruloyl esterase